VEVEIVENEPQPDGRFHIEVRGTRRFEIVGETWEEDSYAVGNVRWLPHSNTSNAGSQTSSTSPVHPFSDEGPAEVQATADHASGGESASESAQMITDAATALEPLVVEWQALVVEGGWQRFSGQLGRCLADIGPMPHASDRSGAVERALWVGALINPLPGLGVAPEIRPGLLACTDDLEMLRIAERGLRESISFLTPSPTTVWLRHQLRRFKCFAAGGADPGQGPVMPEWISAALSRSWYFLLCGVALSLVAICVKASLESSTEVQVELEGKAVSDQQAGEL